MVKYSLKSSLKIYYLLLNEQWKCNLEHKWRIFEIVSNFKHKMERLQILQKIVHEKFYVLEIAAVNLSKLYFLKNAKKTSKPNNCNLNRDWIKHNFRQYFENTFFQNRCVRWIR